MDWNLYPTRPMRIVEIQTWEELKSSLNPYIPTKGKDYPMWNLNTNGRSFSIVSVKITIYNRVQEGSTNVGTEMYQHLWKSTIKKNANSLFGPFSMNVSTRLKNLQRRLLMWNLNPSWCVLCKSDEEDKNHLFNTCSYTKGIWDKVGVLLNRFVNFYNIVSLSKYICRTRPKTKK